MQNVGARTQLEFQVLEQDAVVSNIFKGHVIVSIVLKEVLKILEIQGVITELHCG